MFLALWLACATAPPVPTPHTTQELAFEAIPGNGFAIDGHVYDTAAADYGQKSAFTQSILQEVVPDVFEALGMAMVPVEEAPGGFQRQTSPSICARGELGAERARELAAALGWSLVQWSVLVTDSGGSGTGYATVGFPAPLDAAGADAFFQHAAGVNEALGSGFMAFGGEMRFLNLRGPDGTPYSGLDDAAFVAAVRAAVAGYPPGGLVVREAGELGALLVENPWDRDLAGQAYLDRIDDAAEPALQEARAEFVADLERAADTYGWSRPAEP